MDIDFLSSITDDQTNIMMMHLEKLPNFYDVYADDHHHNDPSSTQTLFTHQETTKSTNLNPNNHLIEDSSLITTPHSTTIAFTSQTQAPSCGDHDDHELNRSSMAAMREMIFQIAAMQPVDIDPETIKPPKRRNVKISKDPQSVAARHRRERISERIRILQRLVPGGTKMDTASMLDEAVHYLKFLKNQVRKLEKAGENRPPAAAGVGFPVAMSSGSYIPVGTAAKGYQLSVQNVHHYLGA